MQTLPLEFYMRDDVVQIAKELVGTVLCTRFDSKICKARIVETEAYRGEDDRACHAYNGRCTPRNRVMYKEGGIAYVYICYGVFHLFNVVTNVKDKADAALIRAVEPIEGEEHMLYRRDKADVHRLTSGPGILSRAMGINVSHSGTSLIDTSMIWIEENSTPIDIHTTTRVGIDSAKEAVHYPWRFYEKGNRWVSKK